MTHETLNMAVSEAKRFIEAAKRVEYYKLGKGKRLHEYTKETATVKRASMDLTRTLADLRQNR